MFKTRNLLRLFDIYVSPSKEDYEEIRKEVGEVSWSLFSCEGGCSSRISSPFVSPLPVWEEIVDIVESDLVYSYKEDPDYWHKSLENIDFATELVVDDRKVLALSTWHRWRILSGENSLTEFRAFLIPKGTYADVELEWRYGDERYYLSESVFYFPGIPVRIICVYEDGKEFYHKVLATESVWSPEDLETLIERVLLKNASNSRFMVAIYVAYNPTLEVNGERKKWVYNRVPVGTTNSVVKGGINRFYSSIAVSSVKRKDKEIDEDHALREALRKALAEESTPLTREELLALILGE